MTPKKRKLQKDMVGYIVVPYPVKRITYCHQENHHCADDDDLDEAGS
jgi:hypothetical protein